MSISTATLAAAWVPDIKLAGLDLSQI